MRPSRRDFVLISVAGYPASKVPALPAEEPRSPGAEPADWRPHPVDLAPAKWIWLPCERTLPNTFVLFRRQFDLSAAPASARAWITADSRYCLFVNGRRVQWGPAPCDPRELDADPVDLAPHLRPGRNVIGVEVLFYGYGEGTWPGGKPGLLFHSAVELSGGGRETIVSDESWSALLDRSHRPGAPKRWFLRSLQEQFDARLRPVDWASPDYAAADGRWIPARVLDCPASKPVSCSLSGGWSQDTVDRVDPSVASVRMREIPLVRETEVPALRLADSGRVEWRRDPEDWFEFRIPGSFRISTEAVAAPRGAQAWELPATPSRDQGVYATFEFKEHLVGWPFFTIDAPEGAVVELMTQESHDPNGPPWLDSHFFAWTRFICREGVNHFEAFDYESLRWMQLHVRGASRPVRISAAGVRRRTFPWPHEPRIRCSDPALQRLFDASINTVRNFAIETVVDGMGRERQQYSGDIGHALHAIRYAFGEPRIIRRYLRTWSSGLTKDGYFLDCWPAYDRIARIGQKELDAAFWGPLLDHGVGFNFDCWNHYLETGDAEALKEPYPRLVRFAAFLESLRGRDGLLPVEGLGVPNVWIDHDAYRRQAHKQCAFNLYAAAMFRHALAPVAALLQDASAAEHYRSTSDTLLAAAQRRFWDASRGVYVVNRPWLDEEKQPRLCDRSLATAILFDQCPGGNTSAALDALVTCPGNMGFSYPANAGWRLWALAKLNRIDVVLGELRTRWFRMESVALNNSLQENWKARPDTADEWSHCPVAPLYIAFMDIAGIRPLAPGFRRFRIRPQLGDIEELDLAAHTPVGPIEFSAKSGLVRVSVPPGCDAEIVKGPDAPPTVVEGGRTFEFRAGSYAGTRRAT